MKRLLSILGGILLIGTSTTSVVSCTEEKCDNELIGNFKKLCSQNNPFHVDNEKWYFVIVKVNDKLNVIKFQNNNKPKDIYNSSEYDVALSHGKRYYSGLVLWIKKDDKNILILEDKKKWIF
ncbi:lipoprotein [Spiroplasma citri]|uniref:lipoprotein n=1 Tax=Spiroplasma citri TaxID=2133 RepID=UPI0011BBA773|nr:lipoprotein [Spiroplasma citri]QED25053.1 hypothetical protein FRX96_06590 [Spiroplasma citri]